MTSERQPNFQNTFRMWGGEVVTPRTYRVRIDSNKIHDICFISSLLHDATILSMVWEHHTLTCEVERVSWETYHALGALSPLRSRLTCKGCRSARIERTVEKAAAPLGTIRSIYYSRSWRSADELWELVVEGDEFCAVLEFDESDFSIVMSDHAPQS